jgi:hypothetical protein
VNFLLIETIFDELCDDDFDGIQIEVGQFEAKVVDEVVIGDLRDEHFHQLRVGLSIYDEFKHFAGRIIYD